MTAQPRSIEFPESALLEAYGQLNGESERLKKGVNSIFGAFDKVGVIPAAAALFFAYTGYRANSTPSLLETSIVAAIVGSYIESVVFYNVSARIEELSKL